MMLSLSIASAATPAYSIPEQALRRWVEQRLRRTDRADGGTIFTFALSGSTCANVPLEVVMSVVLDTDGRIESASSRPAGGAAGNIGCDVMCAAHGDGGKFFATFGECDEVIGLTLAEAAFRDWAPEPSGCFCTAGNRRHKWRNVFQALHYAAAAAAAAAAVAHADR